jgi:hypothetical protein
MRLSHLKRQIERIRAELPSSYTQDCIDALRALLEGKPFHPPRLPPGATGRAFLAPREAEDE